VRLAFRLVMVMAALLGSVMSASPAVGRVESVARTDSQLGREVTDVSLAGEAVVWGELSPDRLGASRTWSVRLGGPGRLPQTRFTARLPAGASGIDGPATSASATHLAVVQPTSSGGRRRLRLLAGPLEGPLMPVVESILTPPVVDWAGSLLMAREDGPEGPVVNVRDASAGFAPRTVSRGPNDYRARIAGTRLALRRGLVQIGVPEDQLDERIDVVRLEDGQTDYSVLVEDSTILDLAVQEDGKVAWLERPLRVGARPELYWASPAEPRPHLVAQDAALDRLRIGLANDRLVFARRAAGRRRDSLRPWVADLAGTARPVWFPLAGSGLPADFDGTRLAVAAGGCVWAGEVDAPAAGPPAGVCPQAVTGEGRRRVSRGGSRYSYTFPCLMAPARGCRGVARYEVAKRERGPRRVVAVHRFVVKLGKTTTVHFRVSRNRLRRLSDKHGDLWLFVSVRSTDAAGHTSVSESFEFQAQP
jgi:hypothetical protein